MNENINEITTQENTQNVVALSDILNDNPNLHPVKVSNLLTSAETPWFELKRGSENSTIQVKSERGKDREIKNVVFLESEFVKTLVQENITKLVPQAKIMLQTSVKRNPTLEEIRALTPEQLKALSESLIK